MNIIELQDNLKNFSQDQLIKEMQMPSGQVPQFLVLGELDRRKKMMTDMQSQKAKEPTVAQEAVAAAGMPQQEMGQMARAMAPKSSIAQNDGTKTMAEGGVVKMAPGGSVGMPVEPFPANSPNPRDRGRWMEKYKDTHNLDGSPKSLSPDLAMQGGIGSLSADVSDYFPPNMRMQTQDKMAAAVSPDRSVPRMGDPNPLGSALMDEYRANMATASAPAQDTPTPEVFDATVPASSSDLVNASMEDLTRTTPNIRGNDGSSEQLELGIDPQAEQERMNQINKINRSELGSVVTEDAPFTGISTSNLEALMGTGALDADQTNRDALPEVIRNNELLRSRGTSSVGSAADLAVPQRETTDPVYSMFEDAKGIPLDPTFGSPTLNTDSITSRLSREGPETAALRNRKTSDENTRPDVDFSDPTMVPDPSFRNPPDIQEKRDITPTTKVGELLNYLPDPAAALQDAGAGLASLLSAQETEEKIPAAVAVKKDDDVTPPATTTSGIEEFVEAEKLRPAPAKTTTTNDDTPKTSPSPRSGGSGMSSLESEIAQMLKDREKSADQDKWMALAQTGLALMASKQPTLGGALGEAGMVGLKNLRRSKSDYQKDKLSLMTLQQRMEQARMTNNRLAAAANRKSVPKPKTASELNAALDYFRGIATEQATIKTVNELGEEVTKRDDSRISDDVKEILFDLEQQYKTMFNPARDMTGS